MNKAMQDKGAQMKSRTYVIVARFPIHLPGYSFCLDISFTFTSDHYTESHFQHFTRLPLNI